jgi:RNA polymerase sigma factor (sigma-70 family)
MGAQLKDVDDCRTLIVRPALKRLIDIVQRDRALDRSLVIALRDFDQNANWVDTVTAFESVVNRCLDDGYRGEGLLAFVFLAMNRRFAARIGRRLKTSRLGARPVDVEDLVMVTLEGVQKLFHRSERSAHSVTYSLLLSIADHRAIDYLRRKKADLVPCVDAHIDAARSSLQDRWRPDAQYQTKEREDTLRVLRAAVLQSVNELSLEQRRALVLVEVEGLGYREVAQRLEMKVTDVGNFVRRTRKIRDGNLIANLRNQPAMEGHIGFAELQRTKDLRTNVLRWAAEIGDGFCFRCLKHEAKLHTADRECLITPVVRVDGLSTDQIRRVSEPMFQSNTVGAH